LFTLLALLAVLRSGRVLPLAARCPATTHTCTTIPEAVALIDTTALVEVNRLSLRTNPRARRNSRGLVGRLIVHGVCTFKANGLCVGTQIHIFSNLGGHLAVTSIGCLNDRFLLTPITICLRDLSPRLLALTVNRWFAAKVLWRVGGNLCSSIRHQYRNILVGPNIRSHLILEHIVVVLLLQCIDLSILRAFDGLSIKSFLSGRRLMLIL